MRRLLEAVLVWMNGGRLTTILKAWKVSRLWDKHTLNPLRHVNRNQKCICGSNSKIKKCCGKQRFVNRKWAVKVQSILCGLTPEQKLQFGYKK